MSRNEVNELAPKYLIVVRADAVLLAVGNRCWEVHADEVQTISITGVSSAGERI